MNNVTTPVTYVNSAALLGVTGYFYKQITALKDEINKNNKNIEDMGKGISTVIPQLNNKTNAINHSLSANYDTHSKNLKHVRKQLVKLNTNTEEMKTQIELLINALIVKKIITVDDIRPLKEEEKFSFSKKYDKKKTKVVQEVESTSEESESEEEVRVSTPKNNEIVVKEKNPNGVNFSRDEDVNELASLISGN